MGPNDIHVSLKFNQMLVNIPHSMNFNATTPQKYPTKQKHPENLHLPKSSIIPSPSGRFPVT